jgi:hypothetical protein
VAANLATAAAGLFESQALVVTTLVMARPSVMARLAEKGMSIMFTIQGAFASYLEAEKRLGRVAPDADVDAVVLALLASAHHLCILHRESVSDPKIEVQRIAEVLVAGIGP